MVEHRGQQGARIDSAITGALYVFSPGTRRLVDARDSTRVLAWREDGQRVIFEIGGS